MRGPNQTHEQKIQDQTSQEAKLPKHRNLISIMKKKNLNW